MNKINSQKKIEVRQIIANPEKYIKWMCYDILISIDSQVFDMSFNLKNERLKNGCYGYTVDGQFRTKTWINKNVLNVLGFVTF